MSKLRIPDLGHFPADPVSHKIEWSTRAIEAIRQKHPDINKQPWSKKIVTIPLSQIRIDRRYQRKTCQRSAFLLVYEDGFDAMACGAVDVVLRSDGFYYVWDGGHRVAMAELAGLPKIAASVIAETNAQDEARSFIKRNAKNRKINKVDHFRAGLFAGEAHFVVMQAALAAANLEVDLDA